MREIASHTDRNGQTVKVGDEVRVLQVDVGPEVEDDEREMFEHMVGATCEIERFDATGRAWVTLWWTTFDGNATTSVGLASHQMEKLGPAAE